MTLYEQWMPAILAQVRRDRALARIEASDRPEDQGASAIYQLLCVTNP